MIFHIRVKVPVYCLISGNLQFVFAMTFNIMLLWPQTGTVPACILPPFPPELKANDLIVPLPDPLLYMNLHCQYEYDLIYVCVCQCLCVCPSVCPQNATLAFICSAMSDTMIMDVIASFLVLPNRLTVPLVADLHVAQLRSPLPRVTHSILWVTEPPPQ